MELRFKCVKATSGKVKKTVEFVAVPGKNDFTDQKEPIGNITIEINGNVPAHGYYEKGKIYVMKLS